MAIKINFDAAYNPDYPTFVLAKKNGDKLGVLNSTSIGVKDAMNDASEISFTVHKINNGEICNLWGDIKNFKLIYCPEWHKWFEITLELNESNDSIKTITGVDLAVAELSQIMLYTIEINTENDIARDEYDAKNPTVLYREDLPSSSLLHRIMEKAPHYKIVHVDDTIRNIQRTFEFDGTSIYDAFQEIAEEVHCLFVFGEPENGNGYDGSILRTISVYDLDSYCFDCGHRGEFTEVCPECMSTNVNEGYGEDTNIFVTSDELADEIQLSVNTAEVKNCFKLEAGDDLMTSTIRNCNPNGTDYIWHISNDVKEDMSEELIAAIESYDKNYAYYQKDYAPLDENGTSKYNELVSKYQKYNSDLEKINTENNMVKGYSALMNAYYNTVDFNLFLKSSLMPSAEMEETNAQEQLNLLVNELSTVAVANFNSVSVTTANSAVLAMAKVIVNPIYNVEIDDNYKPTLTDDNSGEKLWTGKLVISHSSYDEEDLSKMDDEKRSLYTAISNIMIVKINGDYETFVKQKIDKTLNSNDVDDMSISGLFEKELDDFTEELNKYCLNRLSSFLDSCNACIEILKSSDGETWAEKEAYNEFCSSYDEKQSAIIKEIAVRDAEIAVVSDMQSIIIDIKNEIQTVLDFETYLLNESTEDNNLWFEFCSFRREDKYSNDNYISDGLNNAELFNYANEFIKVAKNDIYKSAELQHTISTTLKNLLVMKKFQILVDSFKTGNWIRVMVDDEIFKLRLIEYSIDYDDIGNISVEFADIVKNCSTEKKIFDVLSQASSMATSYSSVQRQVSKSNATINNWIETGLNATNVKIINDANNQSQIWDDSGMLFREYNSLIDDYEPTQLKIVNSTIAITDDSWETIKTAIGNMYYIDPLTEELKSAYGVNAEVIVGKLLIGEGLVLSNSSNTFTFNEEGLIAINKDDTNKVIINPNSDNSVLNIQQKTGDVYNDVLFFNEGKLVVSGEIQASKLTLTDGASVETGDVIGFAKVATSGLLSDLEGFDEFDSIVSSLESSVNLKFNNPLNNDSASTGMYLSKDNSGSSWKSASRTISSTDLSPTCGKAVYDYVGSYVSDYINDNALSKMQSTDNAGKLLYVDDNGNVSFMTIEDLKTLLGV